MEEKCDFIWQIISDSPVLRQRIHELENENTDDSDSQADCFIGFFRELEEMLECITDTYHNTRILNNYSYMARLRS